MKQLREYQQKIVNKVLASNKDTLISLPTGGGKTVIATAIMQGLSGTVVFVVPRLELIKQAKSEFADLGDVDIIWSDKTTVTGSKYIIASKDSLRCESRKKLLPEHVTMIIDEVHISIEASWKLVQSIKPDRVIGLTATPERKDGKALMKGSDVIHKYGIFDEIVNEETVPSLIRKGFLSPLHYYAKPIEGITNIKADNPQGDELSGAQMCRIFDDHDIWGDIVASYEEYGKGRPALGFTTTISMAETVAKLFQNAGYDFRVIHGGMSVKERSELINLLRTGAIAGLVNAELLTYGFDCPCVSYAFSCRHIKSRPLWFQIVGRILRICDGKEDAIFVDHGDSISEFSEPSCSLPILDPLMQWKYDGETKEQRAEVRKKIKRAQDAMKKLQEIDPLPIDMVEVTVEDTWERMMRIIQKQQTDIENLKKEKETIESEHQKQTQNLINARTSLTKCQYDNNELKQKNKQIQTDYQRQNQELAYAKSSLSRLQQENTVLKQRTNQSGNTNGVRKLDRDETFEFIRRRYASIREQCHSHQQTVLEMQKAFSRDQLQYDKDQFNSSMYWWSNHYQEPADYKSDLPWK